MLVLVLLLVEDTGQFVPSDCVSCPILILSWWGLNLGLAHARQPSPFYSVIFTEILLGEKVSFLFCGCLDFLDWGSQACAASTY